MRSYEMLPPSGAVRYFFIQKHATIHQMFLNYSCLVTNNNVFIYYFPEDGFLLVDMSVLAQQHHLEDEDISLQRISHFEYRPIKLIYCWEYLIYRWCCSWPDNLISYWVILILIIFYKVVCFGHEAKCLTSNTKQVFNY